MHQTNSPKLFTNQQQPLLSARSFSYQINLSSENIQQDLQLLIRAHQRIRQLQQENALVKEEKERLFGEVKGSQLKVQSLVEENERLRRANDELLTRILDLEKRVNSTSDSQQPLKVQNHQTRRKSHFQQAQPQPPQSIQQLQTQLPTNQPHQSLNHSQSTPVILNINLNPFSKQQRQSFLESCKQEFAQELSKIKTSQLNTIIRHPATSPSQYFPIPVSNKTSQLHISRNNNFLKQAEQQFMDENSKTLKNICLDDNRRKSVSSSSLIRKNFIGKRYGDKEDRVMFGDKTNVWNSKYASIDQIMKGSACKNTQSGIRIYQTTVQPGLTLTNYPREFMSKPKNNPIYFKSDNNSKSVYYDKNSNKHKKKEIQLELRNNQAVGGIIKYRGLCL